MAILLFFRHFGPALALHAWLIACKAESERRLKDGASGNEKQDLPYAMIFSLSGHEIR